MFLMEHFLLILTHWKFFPEENLIKEDAQVLHPIRQPLQEQHLYLFLLEILLKMQTYIEYHLLS